MARNLDKIAAKEAAKLAEAESAAAEADAEDTSLPPEPRRKPGRPPGSKTKKAAAPPVTPLTPEQMAIQDQQLRTALASIADAPIKLMHLRPLKPEERDQVVGASLPVVYKYAPDVLQAWATELMFFATIWFVYGERWIEARSARAHRGSQRNGKNDASETVIETGASDISSRSGT